MFEIRIFEYPKQLEKIIPKITENIIGIIDYKVYLVIDKSWHVAINIMLFCYKENLYNSDFFNFLISNRPPDWGPVALLKTWLQVFKICRLIAGRVA